MSEATPLNAHNDPETREWVDALKSVIEARGNAHAHQLIESLLQVARESGANIPFAANTAYINTIPADQGEHCPGNLEYEEKLRSWMRWNSIAMVVRANREDGDLGGHLSSFASLANMLGIGFNHFWHAPTEQHGGDLLYIQGHSSPGIYARAFLEGRISADQLDNFRREVDGKGLSSYPHPKLMPDFWQFPTVSMGLGALCAIYQARFLKYLHARDIAKTDNRKVWVFCGDGEMDEPESMGAIGVGGREHLDNLVMVINCNLQRLDGPVRGNGKIIQEFEAEFRGAGWNVIKVIWGSTWDPLLAADKTGALHHIMMNTVDGEYQNFKAKDGAYVREHFFGKHPDALKLVEKYSDDDIWRLTRGGHDPHKIYAAFKQAQEHVGQPTVLLMKTVKGFGLGKSAEARNTAHQTKKLDDSALREIRDRFNIPISDADLPAVPYYQPDANAPEIKYLHERRQALGGYLPQRRQQADEKFDVPELSTFAPVLEASAQGRETSTTQAFVRFLTILLRDAQLGKRVVPILVDEARTFGMEGLFRQIGIFNQQGQLYEPVDKDQVSYYREDKAGQILQEGINEAGAMASWIAAATSYSSNNRIMVPFYIFYSMFGLQRTHDLAWAAGDMRARGFLLGGTSGRTTLNGEGLQHEDGHSHVLAATIPNCMPYDPTFAHEVAVIIHDGLRRMVQNQEDVFYYLTLLNENYSQPGLVADAGQEAGILKGLYLFQKSASKRQARVQLMGSGSILRESLAAVELLENDWKVAADVWSAPSFTLLARDGQENARWNLLHPSEKPRTPYVTEMLAKSEGPIIATTDYMRLYADQIRPYMPEGRSYSVLGTDGFGRSDSRAKLRAHFEVDRHFITVVALTELAKAGTVDKSVVAQAIKKYGLNTETAYPGTL